MRKYNFLKSMKSNVLAAIKCNYKTAHIKI